jgi:hypothetical protein
VAEGHLEVGEEVDKNGYETEFRGAVYDGDDEPSRRLGQR